MCKAGFAEWTRDTVVAKRTDGHLFHAKLAFNYQVLEGIEFELISVLTLTSPNYISEFNIKIGQIAHMGIHIETPGQVDELRDRLGLIGVVQDCTTVEHANPELPPNRRYHYTIYESARLVWPVKLIERVEVDSA